jgi:vacuolar protein sorting-associated protein IST1
VQRLKTLQEKKEAQAKLARRDVATLLERNKLETSRIKVESRVYLSSLAPCILTAHL